MRTKVAKFQAILDIREALRLRTMPLVEELSSKFQVSQNLAHLSRS